MARNKNLPNRMCELKKAVETRHQMLENGELSLSPSEGCSVILTSGETREDIEVLEEHANSLATDTNRAFFGAKIIIQALTDNVREVVKDPEVASIAFIGDGVFGAFNMTNLYNHDSESVTWSNLAKMATHLKTGIIEQRTCTDIRYPHREVRVSLPAFIVADQTHIISTVDKTFANHNGYLEFNEFLKPIYERPHNTAQQLREPIGFTLHS